MSTSHMRRFSFHYIYDNPILYFCITKLVSALSVRRILNFTHVDKTKAKNNTQKSQQKIATDISIPGASQEQLLQIIRSNILFQMYCLR